MSPLVDDPGPVPCPRRPHRERRRRGNSIVRVSGTVDARGHPPWTKGAARFETVLRRPNGGPGLEDGPRKPERYVGLVQWTKSFPAPFPLYGAALNRPDTAGCVIDDTAILNRERGRGLEGHGGPGFAASEDRVLHAPDRDLHDPEGIAVGKLSEAQCNPSARRIGNPEDSFLRGRLERDPGPSQATGTRAPDRRNTLNRKETPRRFIESMREIPRSGCNASRNTYTHRT